MARTSISKSSKRSNGHFEESPEIGHSNGSEEFRSVVAQRAWEIWQAEGCPEGKALEHWLRAEREVTGERGTSAISASL